MNAARKVAIVSARYRSPTCRQGPLLNGLAPVAEQRLKPADDVEEVRAQQRQRRVPAPGLGACALADENHEGDQDRDRRGHQPSDQRVDRRDPDQHGDGNGRREQQLGQVAGEIALERVDAGDRARRKVTGARARGPAARRSDDEPVGQPAAQFRDDAGRGTPTVQLEARAHGGPCGEHGAERDQFAAQRPQRGVADGGAGDDRCQQRRLGHDQQRFGDRQCAARQQVTTGRGGLPHQPPIDRPGHSYAVGAEG